MTPPGVNAAPNYVLHHPVVKFLASVIPQLRIAASLRLTIDLAKKHELCFSDSFSRQRCNTSRELIGICSKLTSDAAHSRDANLAAIEEPQVGQAVIDAAVLTSWLEFAPRANRVTKLQAKRGQIFRHGQIVRQEFRSASPALVGCATVSRWQASTITNIADARSPVKTPARSSDSQMTEARLTNSARSWQQFGHSPSPGALGLVRRIVLDRPLALEVAVMEQTCKQFVDHMALGEEYDLMPCAILLL
eukprot:TRINITY_DN18725_c0_g2_i1.p1 TRINITY_DN18725_c0_g2~~TRINITY_DN18725_c0_g2_i1.p1  ORF type:complete len:248 (+),score=31.96 TRINITY_DN18725_c0_g2_i1:289-1032(+)